MNLLVTAGNTQVPIDRVRCLTNIFTGRTGAQVALRAFDRGHAVTLLTSRPAVIAELRGQSSLPGPRWSVQAYQTFDDLQENLERSLAQGSFEAVIHSAAVSDYLSAGVYAPAPHTQFQAHWSRWQTTTAEPPTLVDRSAGKVKSDEPELWLRLVRAPKLIDRFRSDWGFRGVLVKFKLEVGATDETLIEIAERSRLHSRADLIVANTLEGSKEWAFLGPLSGRYERVSRSELAACLVSAVERLHEERTDG
jgi:phosphopantothenoylcysteine synthetase/decarboxylase